jgi:hypothetical protein
MYCAKYSHIFLHQYAYGVSQAIDQSLALAFKLVAVNKVRIISVPKGVIVIVAPNMHDRRSTAPSLFIDGVMTMDRQPYVGL